VEEVLTKKTVNKSFSDGEEAFRSECIDWDRTAIDTAYLAGIDAANREDRRYELLLLSTQDHVRSVVEVPFQIPRSLREDDSPLALDIDLVPESLVFRQTHLFRFLLNALAVDRA